jgi:spermidine synthase
VAVVEDERHRSIVLNNFYLLGGTASTGDERQQGHLPLLLHPHPARVAFLGMGTGITAGAALLHPVERVVVLELVPEVVHAAKDHFAEANLGLAGDRRVEIRQEDARNYLAACGSAFDVIVGDLVVPWRPGESSLYALEHLQRARRALRPGGIFCQWLPLFQLSREQFEIALATFLDVFPHASLWRGDFLADQPALALVGHLPSSPGMEESARDALPLDVAAADRRARDLAARLDRLNPYLAHPAGLWLFLVGPLSAEDARPAGSRRNRDAEPWIELLLPPAPGGRIAPTRAFLGRALESFLDEVAKRPLEGTALANLDGAHRAWRDAGARLWHASLLAAEGRTAEAQALGLETLGKLPGEIQRAVTGGMIKSPGGSPPPRG